MIPECNEVTPEIAKAMMIVNMKVVTQIVNKIFPDLTLFCSLLSLTYKVILYSGSSHEIILYAIRNNCTKFDAFVPFVPKSSKFRTKQPN